MPRIIITEPGKTPQPYRLKTDRIVTKIGRASDNDIIITAGSASTYHCKIKRVEGGFILVDNNSTNGIKHEDTSYSIIDLEDGMTVQIGDDIDMDFNLSDDEQETLSSEDFEPQQRASFPKPQSLTRDEANDDDVILKKAKPISKSQNKSFNNDHGDKPNLGTGSEQNTAINRQAAAKSSSGISFVIFILLAAIFFGGGLALRHYQDHKTFIFSK